LVGYLVSSFCVQVPGATYEVFRLADQSGIDSAQVCFALWQHIWQKTDLKRAYSFDFERHQPDGLIEIYIAIKTPNQ
jgi:predicted transcriptional regulator YdeE